MMKSMFSGVSGLKTHQIRMDVIGNNIANVNTVGYKSSRMTFQEIYSQTVRGAGASGGGIGGTNPQQIGLGVTVGAIDVNHSKGSIQRTDSATDIMVDGSGFFVLTNDVNANNKFYSRAGNFVLDNLGYLVAPNGFKVLGIDGKPVQLNRSETKAATPTTSAILDGNINTTESTYQTDLKLYDSLGALHQVDVKFTDNLKGSDAGVFKGNSYRKVLFTETGSHPPNTVPATPYAAGPPEVIGPIAAADEIYIKFGPTGDPIGLVRGVGKDATTGLVNAETLITTATASTLTIKIPGANDLTMKIDNNLLYKGGDATATNKVASISQRAQDTSLKATRLNGNAAGLLNSFSIAANGEVSRVYTNGEKSDPDPTKGAIYIQLADFDNPPGLMKMGANLFSETSNSGVPKFGKPGTGAFGQLAPGALEMSNVDLSQEFTDMITTQRGFQANSKIITTTDEMLQELVNLKR